MLSPVRILLNCMACPLYITFLPSTCLVVLAHTWPILVQTQQVAFREEILDLERRRHAASPVAVFQAVEKADGKDVLLACLTQKGSLYSATAPVICSSSAADRICCSRSEQVTTLAAAAASLQRATAARSAHSSGYQPPQAIYSALSLEELYQDAPVSRGQGERTFVAVRSLADANVALGNPGSLVTVLSSQEEEALELQAAAKAVKDSRARACADMRCQDVSIQTHQVHAQDSNMGQHEPLAAAPSLEHAAETGETSGVDADAAALSECDGDGARNRDSRKHHTEQCYRVHSGAIGLVLSKMPTRVPEHLNERRTCEPIIQHPGDSGASSGVHTKHAPQMSGNSPPSSTEVRRFLSV